ncbi:MAG: glycosyltransferase [Chitinophagaceae bacterium]
MKEKILILIPVYNDNVSVNLLLQNIAATFDKRVNYSILLVNDGSTEPLKIVEGLPIQVLTINLKRNIGHQKAIAIGLAYCRINIACSKILIMDGDGQDNPEDALKLSQESGVNPDKIIVASRRSRQESRSFKLFYILYKLLFKILTGKRISFGNFMIIPKNVLDKLVFYSEIWNHLPGGIIKSGLPFNAVQIDRGKRYFEKSKMNFNALVLHGLGAISVFLDLIATRLLIFSFTLIVISLVIIISIIAIKSFTKLAIPGWTSTVVSSFIVILLQSFLLSLFTIFLYLISQSQRKFIPGDHYPDYIDTVVSRES